MKMKALGLGLALLGFGARAAVAASDFGFFAALDEGSAALFAPQDAKAPQTHIQYVGHSVEHALSQKEVYMLAEAKALPRLKKLRGDWAIVLDVDETVLSNFEYQQRIAASGRGYEPDTWDVWVNERKATAIPGAKNFLDQIRAIAKKLRRQKGRIVFVTDRNAAQEQATIDNLVAEGLFVPGQDLILTRKDKADTKEVRRACVENGSAGTDERCKSFAPAKIAALFGDSFRDFFEYFGADVYGKGREELEKCMDAGRCFVIPNPLYGQWQEQGAAGPYEKFKPKAPPSGGGS